MNITLEQIVAAQKLLDEADEVDFKARFREYRDAGGIVIFGAAPLEMVVGYLMAGVNVTVRPFA